jgi:hypothetical protein
MNMVYFRIYAFAAVAMLLVISSACHHQPTADINFEPQPRTILAKIGLNNTRDPNLTVSSSGVLGLLTVYSDSTGNHVGYTMSHDGGDSFMPIAPVSDPAAKVSAHGESAPALATGGEAIYALWQQRSEKGANQLAVARSLNYGRSFDTPVIVTGDEAPGFHGFASLGVSPQGAIYATWLDGRELTPGSGTFAVYISRSTDRGATFDQPHRVALSACPCCRPGIAFGPKNQVIIAWRKVFDGDIRDLVVSISNDGGQTFVPEVRVSDDGWHLNACPDSGPSLAVKDNRIYVAWLTEGREHKARIQLSWSDDLGKTFHSPVVGSQGVLDPNHARLKTSEDGMIALAFQGRESGAQSGWGPVRVFVNQIEDGQLSRPIPVPDGGQGASYPALGLGTAGRIYLAWTSATDQSSNVNMVRARVR